jgi:type 1 glutamine amidotransferase
VAFLSTTGELPLPNPDAFFKWVAEGHAFIGLHSATDTLHQSPEYIKMIGADFAGHGSFHPTVPVDNMDPASPITAGWGKSIPIDEEFYLFKSYDPKQVHLLLAMPIQPYTRETGVYPVSWTRKYGNGRVFYTSLGHRDDVLLPDATIGDAEFKVRYNHPPVAPAVQKHVLQGIRWALGLLDADATPQAH